MGKYRPYAIGGYRLGQLGADAVAVWTEQGRRRRFRLGKALGQGEAEAELLTFAKTRSQLIERGTVTCQAVFERYIADRELDGKPTRHQRAAWKQLSPFFGRMNPADIDKAACRAYETRRTIAGRKPGTIWTELTDLRAILMWGYKQRPKLLPEPPTIFVRPKPDPKNLFLTRDQYDALVSAAIAPHIRLFIILALTTAGRVGAILDLKWNRIDFDGRTIDLYDPAQARNSKGRALVPMNNSAAAALQEARQAALSDHVVEWSAGRVLSVKNGIKAAARRAGVPWCTPHVIRHTAARFMAEACVPMEQIAQYLGHKNVSTTYRVYARFSPDFLQGAARAVEVGGLRRVV